MFSMTISYLRKLEVMFTIPRKRSASKYPQDYQGNAEEA